MTNSPQSRKEDHELLQKLIKEAAKLLPCQAPLQSFVHHNTLHNFEHCTFKKALERGSETFGSKCFMNDDFFREALANGRIDDRDLDKIIFEECSNANDPIFNGGPTHFAFRKWRLKNFFAIPTAQSLNWYLHENQIFHHPHQLYGTACPNAPRVTVNGKELLSLWHVLETKNHEEEFAAQGKPLRIRDKILAHYDIDIDELTRPVLIRLCSAYLDQGIALNHIPQRDQNFLSSFRKIYSNDFLVGENWMKGISRQCHDQKKHGYDAYQTINEILEIFDIQKPQWKDFIIATLLSLRGWAGMFYQFESNPDRIPIHYLPAKVADFLAVQLTLELKAAQSVLKTNDSNFTKLFNKPGPDFCKPQILQYEAFVLAQAFALSAESFDSKSAKKWLKEIAEFNDFERKYHLHLAFEHHYRQMIVESLSLHQKQQKSLSKHYRFQAVFCMDEREESLRRQLEEICPDVETFGFAGFYGVAMQYLGLDDIRPQPLCPVVITPDILVQEVAIDHKHSKRYVRGKKIFGHIANFLHRVRKSLFHGAIWAFFVGIFKIIPLAGRSLFPLQTTKILNHFHKITISRPKTRLILERTNDDERKFGFKIGFSVDEMTNIVFSVLDSMGLKKNFAPLVIMVGHGSSSINNPHESAYNCGATGGGKGSANARAFAMMANDQRIRNNLKSRGISIPDETMFVGCLHDTCDDSITYYDTEIIANTKLRKDLRYLEEMLAKACKNNAHERCRRFDSVPKGISADQAKIYVEQRSIDLAQPRPEYGHGTNAICIVGRRSKTAGLFLDRRAFLISYDPENDHDGKILGNILHAATPVGAGISLEYYFSAVDQFNYGCGTKLPHNIAALIGVMDGYCSDLRTGLPWQTVEIHEPMRLLMIIEASPETLLHIAEEKKEVGILVKNDWVQLVSLDPKNGSLKFYHRGKFEDCKIQAQNLPQAASSKKYYSNSPQHLCPAEIQC